MQKPANENSDQFRQMEKAFSELKFELEEIRILLEEEKEKRQFFQLIADFTFGWELWFNPGGEINYCSPSCFDLTGYTSNQIISSSGIAELLVFESDQAKYSEFVSKSLEQMVVSQTLDFRILTRTKQLRWCTLNVRGVYDKQGKYLGIRASIQDVTRLKRAMGHIQEMEAEKEIENRTKLRMQSELSSKDRELVSFLLQLSQKNELLTKVTTHVKSISSDPTVKNHKKLLQLAELLESKSVVSLDWTNIENQLEKIHPGFFSRLQNRHPSISVKDKRLCAYLRLGLSSKEISGLQNITPKSVEISRVRLRKKLKLAARIRLSNYLSQL